MAITVAGFAFTALSRHLYPERLVRESDHVIIFPVPLTYNCVFSSWVQFRFFQRGVLLLRSTPQIFP